MNWYKRIIESQFPGQYRKVPEDKSRINPYFFEDSEVDEGPSEYSKYKWDQQVERNSRHHKKMRDIMPLEEKKKELERRIKLLGQYYDPDSQARVIELEKLIVKIDRKIGTIIARK